MILLKPLFLLLLSNLFSQVYQDARMLGLNGSYTNLARGYRAVGINPANLSIYDGEYWNILDCSSSIGNNFFSIKNYNTLSGAHLSDTSSANHYPEDRLLDKFGVVGLRLRQSFDFPLPGLSMSKGSYAITSRLNSTIDFGFSDGILQLLFSGNPLGKEINLRLDEVYFLTNEIGFSQGYDFDGFHAGFTLKYLLGILYMGMETLPSENITTDINGFHGNSQYLIRQDIGGNGLGLDIGMVTDEFDDGFRFGMSIINLFGKINWSGDSFIRDLIEPSLSEMDYYLRPNEYVYVNLVLDSVAISTFKDESDELFFYYEKYKVCPVEEIESIIFEDLDSLLVVELSDGTYLAPSEGEYQLYDLYGDSDSTYMILDNYSKFSRKNAGKLTTRQPMYFRMSLSKEWDGQAIVAMDMVTGFRNRFYASSNWRLSMGAEITRYKNQFLRMGYSIGGMEKKSLSIGYGVKIFNLLFDLGISYSGGYSYDSAQGINFAIGFMRKIG